MKVLWVEAYPGFRGAQRSLAALLRGIERRRGRIATETPVTSTVLCLAPGRAEQGYRDAGVEVQVLSPPASLRAYGGSLRRLRRGLATLPAMLSFSRRLRRFLRQHRPDVVHCNQARGVLLVGPAARSLGLPLTWHQRGLLDLPPVATQAAGLWARHVVCVSEAVRRSLPANLRRRSTVVANGIDPPARPPIKGALRRSLGIDEQLRERRLAEDAVVLITASSFLPYKGLHHVVSALRTLAQRQPTTLARLLWIVLGDADRQPVKQAYREQLRAAVADGSLSNHVWWVGWQERATEWLAAADLCLLPTVDRELWTHADGTTSDVVCSEGFPRTILESMAVGTPVVASDVAAVREQLVDGDSGRIVAPGDPQALAEAIHVLATEPERRHAMASAGQQRVQRFSIETMTEQTLSILKTYAAG